MPNLSYEGAIQSIIGTAGNYRRGEIGAFDFAHVQRWVEQFQVTDEARLIILNEMNDLLGRFGFFISKKMAKDCLKQFFKSIKGSLPGKDIRNVNFIRNQPIGKSQSDLLILVDNILNKKYGVTTADCGGSDVYLYIDDAIYSGSKFRYDMRDWLKNAPAGINLITYHLVYHLQGYEYAGSHVQSCVNAKTGTFSPWRSYVIPNCRRDISPVKFFWPRYLEGSEQVDAYARVVTQQREAHNVPCYDIFRGVNVRVSPGLFSSPRNQDIVEQAFLRVGAQLYFAAHSPGKNMRPMGFDSLSSLGFGSPIITYRNTANNCPLALWYGDPDNYGPDHPFGQWYPLFKRKN